MYVHGGNGEGEEAMTTEGPNTSPEPPNGGTETSPFYRRWWFIAIAVVVVLGVIVSLGGNDDEDDPIAAATTTTTLTGTTTSVVEATTTLAAETTSTSESAPTTTTTTVPTTTSSTAPPGPEPAFGSGIQVVGEDVQPGIYETGFLGDDLFDGCYWERLAGFSGEFDDIIANNNAVGHDVVEIASSDAGFSSQCDAWYELISLDEPMTTIPQGKWVVGAHIQSGTYRAEGGDSCYWERLSGVSGQFDDIIANDLPGGSAIVEIGANDYAFNSTGCGEWEMRG